MDLQIRWHKPYSLVDGSRSNLIYNVDKLEDLSDVPGIYIFARKFGDLLQPIYVGKAQKFSDRIKQQLNNVSLMKGIENNYECGYRVLLLGELLTKPGQQIDKALRLIESTVIEYFLAEGYELLNKQGTKTQVDTINFEGNQDAKNLFPSGSRMTKMRS